MGDKNLMEYLLEILGLIEHQIPNKQTNKVCDYQHYKLKSQNPERKIYRRMTYCGLLGEGEIPGKNAAQ